MAVRKKYEREIYHTLNHALRDSISLSLFFSRYALKKWKQTPFESKQDKAFFISTSSGVNTLIFLYLILCVNFSITAQSNYFQNETNVVVIDAGHGGHDSGTKDGKGHFEKNINLYVAKYIKYYLKKYNPDIKVVLTRDEDIFLPLERRPIYAKATNADLFISLHCNHNPNSQAEGVEIYVQNTNRENAQTNLKKALLFCHILDNNIVEKLGYKSRGIMLNNFQVLRESISFTPSVLIEMGFFSNKDESIYLNSKKGINGLSLAVTKSIMDYFEKR